VVFTPPTSTRRTPVPGVEFTVPAPVVVNLTNNNTNQQKQQGGGTTTIIKEKTVEKATPAATPAKPKEEEPW
jgi:hypothetical protein